jgi:hypothetical protein
MFDMLFCNAVNHIFISQMKSKGTMLTSTSNKDS